MRNAECGLWYKLNGSETPNSELRTPHSKGFTLIETIITLVVLSVAALGVLAVFSASITTSADPLLTSQATQLAQERIDTIMGDRRNPALGYAQIIPAKYPAENPVTGFAGFSRTTLIYCVLATDLDTDQGVGFPPPCASGYAHVRVTVSHATLGNISIDTIVANY